MANELKELNAKRLYLKINISPIKITRDSNIYLRRTMNTDRNAKSSKTMLENVEKG